MTKRRYSDLLPGYLQTDDLRKFFSATVDQMFQPGRAEPLNGYIGKIPSYFDATKDFYVNEPTLERQSYQLEATMIGKTDSAISRVLFYNDLVSNLRSQGSIVDNHARLFEGDYYSWSPPVDLDKLNNPQNYYWFGDDPESQPALPLRAQYILQSGNGTNRDFVIPAVVPAWAGKETVSVFVDGFRLDDSEFTVSGSTVTLNAAPADTGTLNVTVYRYGDLKKVIEGNVTFDVSTLNNRGVRWLTTGMRVELRDAVRHEPGFDTQMWDEVPWDNYTQSKFLVDGVGVSITLNEGSGNLLSPMYAVIDRKSSVDSPWSRNNLWVYRDAVAWSGETFPDKVGRRPIIEFRGDVELWNYGRNRAGTVDAVMSQKALYGSGWDVPPWDDKESPIVIGDYDNTTPIDAGAIDGQLEGTVLVDDNVVLQVGMRLLIAYAVPGRPDLSHSIFTVEKAIDNFSNEVMTLVPADELSAGDMVTLPNGDDFVFNGTTWARTQAFSPDTPPLFMLYDLDCVALNDPGVYPENDFSGSTLFAYADGTGAIDAVLNKPLRYDHLGQIMFDNKIATERFTYADGEIAGFYFFKNLGETEDEDTFSNDWHLVDFPSSQTADPQGNYSIPLNLQANPDNEPVKLITRSDWFEHFASIMVNQEGFAGEPYSTNNWRDTARKLNVGTRILQHRSPLLKTMLLSADKDFGVIQSARFVDQEYTRFRNRVAQRAYEFILQGTMAPTASANDWLSAIIDSLKISKTSDFPFALSEVAVGQNFIPPTAVTMGLHAPTVPHVTVDDTYGEPIDMLVGHDGSRSLMFAQSIIREADGVTDAFVLDNDPLGTVTVTVNGAAAAFTLSGNVVTLSSTPASGSTVRIHAQDPRDQIMLALETRIYNGIKPVFKNGEQKLFELITYVDGKFRDAGEFGYRREEFSQIMSSFFLRWAQKNGLDYRKNATFDQSNPFTWNYSNSVDRDGHTCPGNWRGIFRHYYDTDRPHVAPWEMLGFSSKPAWWESEYGVAPYTSGNTKLWEDLRDGVILQGPRQGVDERFVRPALFSVLPVNSSGELLDPITANIIPQAPGFVEASRPWVVGDHGPVENLWMNSTSYPFARACAAYLMKPARFIEFAWEPNNLALAHSQTYFVPTGDRPAIKTLRVHGEADETGARQAVTGIQQWIVEAMISRGQSPTILGDAVRGLGVQLAYKVAGFTTQDNLRVYADNFGLVPQEDVNVVLHTSPSTREEFYSGMLIEWTGSGWAIIGYDSIDPNFKVLQPDTAGPKITISLSDESEPVIVEWKSNVFYRSDMLVHYGASVYRCETSHTSTSSFEQKYWSAEPGIGRSTALKIVKYLEYSDEPIAVPYGTIFQTPQEIADFMFGYERYLESRGWVFRTQTEEADVIDWTFAFKQYLEWAQLEWAPGNFITLSPGTIGLEFHTDHGMIYSLEDSFSGQYGIVDRAGMPIDRRDTFVTRIDGDVTISVLNDDLFGVRVNVGEIEHAIVFSNITIFNDIIYKPVLDLRQDRLRLIGSKAPAWNGRLDAPGFVVSDGQIVPNFEGAADEIRRMFDIEGASTGVLREHARHLIGYEKRDYLDNLLLSETQQFEFYQGLIHQKGAPNALNRLLRSQYIGQERDLRFLDEWAIKLSSYGAIDRTVRVSFALNQSDIKRNPQFIQFADSVDLPDAIILDASKYIDQPAPDRRVFPRRANVGAQIGDMPTAGPIRLDEVDHTAFRSNDILSLYLNEGDLATDQRVWVYEDDIKLSWDVLHVTNMSADGSENAVRRVEVSDSYPGARIYMEKPHGLPLGSSRLFLVIDGSVRTQADVSGVQRIVNVTPDYIEIEADASVGYRWIQHVDDSSEVDDLPTADDPENSPKVRVLRSVRFNSVADADNAAVWMRPTVGELAYIDLSSGWSVRRWEGNWNNVHRAQPRLMESKWVANALIYDRNTQITDKSLLAEPLVLDHMLVYDPQTGLIAGDAEKELSYKLEYDPAVYVEVTGDEGTVWGSTQLGQLWWDLSAVRFLEAQTDLPRQADLARREAEMQHRINTWGKIAPGTSVDVYEWVRSTVLPSEWSEEGTVFSETSYVHTREFDPHLNRLIEVYYFWVKNRTKIQPQARLTRNLDSRTVARLIENPTTLGVPWVAPIAPDAFIISGASQYLNDAGTIVQLETQLLNTDGVVHTEWALMRANDERSTPSEYLWDRMVDSISGMNDAGMQVPDMTLHPSMRLGLSVSPRQSMFVADDARNSILAARESFIGIVNLILSRTNITQERPDFVESLDRSDDVLGTMFWTSETDRHFQAPVKPSSKEITYVVKSLAERNRLLLLPEFRASQQRVYIDRLADDRPQFSVWKYDPVNDTYGSDDDLRMANADALFEISSSFDHVVNSMAEMQAGSWEDGDWIKVNGTFSTDGFWSIWKHSAGEFELIRAQRYRLTDFWDYVDWYADGYSASNPPIISYETVADRNIAENPNPTSTFVKINDDGTGSWAWTAFIDGEWELVAREKATIRLSDKFFDANRAVYGGEVNGNPAFVMGDVRKRDGSYEIRVIAEVLKQSGLTDLEKNELFFSMVHFAHSRLDQVPWAFKTSFLYIAGYNQQLTQSPVNVADTTSNLISYLEEIKPYRVKIREFAQTLAPPNEALNVRSTDFDKPPYFDSSTGSYRSLSLSSAADVSIMANNIAWKDWYESRNKTGTDVSEYDGATWNPIRRLKTRLAFDRVDGVFGLTGNAATRIEDHYDPSSTMAEKNLNELLKLDFKGTTFRGDILGAGTTIEVELDGNTTSTSNTLNPNASVSSPEVAAGRPEEMAIVDHQDFIYFNVKSDGKPGAPKQTVRFHDVTTVNGAEVTLSYLDMAQTNDGVIVFADGLRLLNEHFAIDHFSREVTVSMVNPWTAQRVRHFYLQSVGSGGSTKIKEQSFFTYSSGPQQFKVGQTGEVEVVINGERSTGAISNTTVTVPGSLTSGDQIMINVRAPSGDASLTPVLVFTEVLDYDVTNTWQLNMPSTPDRPDAHVVTIAELDGLRLIPPATYYGSIIADSRHVQLMKAPLDPENVKIIINDAQLADVPVAAPGGMATVQEVLDGGPYASDWVLLGDKLICVSDSVQTENVRVYVLEDHDYTVSPTGEFKVRAMTSSQKLQVTTFRNCNPMDIRTVVLEGRTDGIYYLPLGEKLEDSYYWITLNGKRQIAGVHFQVIEGGIWFRAPHTDADILVATMFRGDVAEIGNAHVGANVVPLRTIMRPISEGDWDTDTWDFSEWDSGEAYSQGESSQGTRVINHMDGGWEYFTESASNRGWLIDDVDMGSDDIRVRVEAANSVGVFAREAFRKPQPDSPGVIWINGERIEYAKLTKSGSNYTLSGLKRGTRGTRIGSSQRLVQQYEGDGVSDEFELTGATSIAGILVTITDDTGSVTLSSDDYSATVSSGNVVITLNEPLDEEKHICITQTVSIHTHKADTKVVAAANVYDPDRYTGNVITYDSTDPWILIF